MDHVQATEPKTKIHGENEGAANQLRERVEHVRDIVETVRDKAEVAIRENPYLVPVAAGAVGLGIGVLIGSRLTRFVLFTAVGALLSDALGGEIKRLASDYVGELQKRLADEDDEAGATASASRASASSASEE